MNYQIGDEVQIHTAPDGVIKNGRITEVKSPNTFTVLHEGVQYAVSDWYLEAVKNTPDVFLGRMLILHTIPDSQIVISQVQGD